MSLSIGTLQIFNSNVLKMFILLEKKATEKWDIYIYTYIQYIYIFYASLATFVGEFHFLDEQWEVSAGIWR